MKNVTVYVANPGDLSQVGPMMEQMAQGNTLVSANIQGIDENGDQIQIHLVPGVSSLAAD